MALVWIDPNYFGSLCSNPNKIQTNDMVGGVMYFCHLLLSNKSCQHMYYIRNLNRIKGKNNNNLCLRFEIKIKRNRNVAHILFNLSLLQIWKIFKAGGLRVRVNQTAWITSSEGKRNSVLWIADFFIRRFLRVLIWGILTIFLNKGKKRNRVFCARFAIVSHLIQEWGAVHKWRHHLRGRGGVWIPPKSDDVI